MDSFKKIQKARTQLVINQPFFSVLVLRTDCVATNEIEKIECDGRFLRYNPDYIDQLEVPQVMGALAQAALHIGLTHNLRRGTRDAQKWDLACDYAANAIVDECDITLPPEAALNKAYAGKSAEEIYTLLPDGDGKNNQPNGQGAGAPPPGWNFSPMPDPKGSGEDGQPTKGELQQMENDAKQMMNEAAVVAKQQGKLPASIQRMIDELNDPVVPWEALLREYLTEKKPDDYSWNKGNRRFISSGLYLPSIDTIETGEVVVCVDTSGSIGREELNRFGSEINSILQDLKPRKVIVIYCDAAINKVVEFEEGDDVVLEAVGGGGTCFRPPFEYVESNDIKPHALVYLTDAYGSFPDEPTYPVVWAVTNHDAPVPFGHRVYVEV